MKIKEIRETLGYSSKQASELIGCSQTDYSRYENGSRRPSVEMLINIADAFDVSLDHLVGRPFTTLPSISEREKDFLELLRNSDARSQEDAYDLLSKHHI